MSHEQQKPELPKWWKHLNFYSLNLAYGFFVIFLGLQSDIVTKILTKAFGSKNYDTVNGWVLIFLLVTAAGGGILSFVRMSNIKKVINKIEQHNNGDQTDA